MDDSYARVQAEKDTYLFPRYRFYMLGYRNEEDWSVISIHVKVSSTGTSLTQLLRPSNILPLVFH